MLLRQVMAQLYPEPGKGGRGKRNASVSEGFSPTHLSMARAVYHHARDLVESAALASEGTRAAGKPRRSR